MKLRTLGLLLAVPLIFLGACDESGDEGGGEDAAVAPDEGGATPADGGGGATPADGGGDMAAGPAGVCTSLIAAIKAKNVDDVVAASVEGAAEMITADSIGGMAAALGSATCGAENVDGDAATVTATAGEETREIPFKKVGDDWKFDAAAYAAKYPAAAAEGGKKKAAKKKAAPAKKKGKKKKK
jgi:hypothetical protein